MEVTKIVINDIEITTLDKPIGLEVNKLSLDRDFQYSCIDTSIEAELKFYCASGKTQLDAEYESKGVEGSGYVDITDTCGSNAKTYRFNLDFKKYNNQGDYTTVGLIDVNSLWKQDLNKEVNLDRYASGSPTNLVSDFYVRNLPLEYKYFSEGSEMNEILPTVRQDLIWPPLPTYPLDWFYIFHKTKTTLNELEDGSNLLANQIVGGEGVSYTPPSNSVVASSNGVFATLFTDNEQTTIEIEPIFENLVDDGEIDITTIGDNGIILDIKDTTYSFQYARLREHIIIGNSLQNPRIILNCHLFGGTTGVITSVTPTNYSNNFVTGTHTENYHTTYFGLTGNILNVKKGEKVWHYYSFVSGFTSVPSPVVVNGITFSTGTVLRFINYKEISIQINRSLDISFRLSKNVANSISSSSDVEPFHTKTSAYYGQTVLSHIFNCAQSFAQTPCYNDLWFSKGDLIRGKVNKADTIVKPSDFFRELEKIVCCGLGYFYDTNPSGEKRLMSVYDFYSDDLVPSQYQFDYNDLIDGKIELAPFLSPYYKEVQIGYSNFKDSPKDYSKQNTYSIDNISENTYSKISDFIASQYIITRALRLGTEDKELEFDNNIFILSGGQLGTYNATLSQTSGVLQDNIFTNPLNTAGINRRYATALNLFRHLYKWGFSLFANKTDLKVVKYEKSAPPYIYDYEIRDTTGSSTNPYYHGLSLCKLPLDNYAKVDRSIEDIYTDFIQSGLYVPTQITFKTANLSSLDLIAMRAHQYDLFSVTDGVNTYYGNLISANLENDITEIKLLRRFKNGI
jgi:hypothetical protein